MRIINIFVVCLFLMACGTAANPNDAPMQRTNEQIKFSTVDNQTGTDQQPANDAKEIIAPLDELTAIYAVNSAKKILIALDVAQHHRLQLKDIRKKITLQIEKELPRFEVHVSTDQKIIQEIENLEQRLQNNNVTSFDLEQEIDEILSLSKEQT